MHIKWSIDPITSDVYIVTCSPENATSLCLHLQDSQISSCGIKGNIKLMNDLIMLRFTEGEGLFCRRWRLTTTTLSMSIPTPGTRWVAWFSHEKMSKTDLIWGWIWAFLRLESWKTTMCMLLNMLQLKINQFLGPSMFVLTTHFKRESESVDNWRA